MTTMSEEQRQSDRLQVICLEMYRQTQRRLGNIFQVKRIWDVYHKTTLITAHEIGYDMNYDNNGVIDW